MSLLSELKRRNVFRVALAYIVLAWLVLQVADVLVDALELPATLSKTVIALLVLGFIPTLVFSWVYELTPEGVKRERDVVRDESITQVTGRKLNLAVLIMLGLAIGLFVTDRFMGPRAPAVVPAAAPPAGGGEVPVVAVLPLQALSTEEEGRFLASGLHDDLLTRLAQLDAFRVISRTSVMEYVGTTKNLRQIGAELGAGFIVEGGLQAIGGRVRINAQLIDAATDEHLWAQTFERPLTTGNLFNVQAEIAAAIAKSLHATLSPREVAVLDEVPTDNLPAYEAYLRGLTAPTDLSRPSMYRTLAAFEEAVDLDPGFAAAWAHLAIANLRIYWEEGGETGTGPDPARREAARAALERAQSLGPRIWQTPLAEAYYHYYGFRDYAAALVALARAEAVAPHNFTIISLRGFLLRRLGRMSEAADVLLRATRGEPNRVGHLRETPITLVRADRCAEALELRQSGLERFPDNTGVIGMAAWVGLFCERDFGYARQLAAGMQVTTRVELASKFELLAFSDDLQAAIAALEQLSPAILRDPVNRLVASNLLAWGYRTAGQPEQAEAALAAALEAAGEIPEHGPGILAHRAVTAALRGDAEATLGLGREALAAMPEDALVRPDIRTEVLRAWAIAGLLEPAMEQLAVLRDESGRTWFALNRYDPMLEPLRQHPRFEELLPPGA